MKSQTKGKFYAALVLFGLLGQIAWVVENMYLNVFIYKMFAASAGDIRLMVSASAIAATLTTVFMGALSDKIGKRRLFIAGGYVLWGISILAFAVIRLDVISAIVPMTVSAAAVGVSLTVVMDCIMTFFGSTANDAAFNAWLTDSTTEKNRGAAEGLNAMMPLIAILFVFGGMMLMPASISQDMPLYWTVMFCIIGGIVLLAGVLGFFLVRDPDIKPSSDGYFSTVFYGFRPSTVKMHASLYVHLIVFVLFNIAIQIFMPYLIIYYEVSLGMADYVLVMAPAIILASVATALWGRVYDKKGFQLTGILAMLWMCAGFVLLFFFRAKLLVFIGSLLMMCGYLCGAAVFGAKIRDLTPEGKAGRLQGVRIFAQVLLPGVIGPWIGELVLSNAEKIVNGDGTESFVPNANIFLAALVVAVIVLLLIVLIKDKKKPNLQALHTPFEEDVHAWEKHYPRPWMRRECWQSLCGEWELSVIGKKGIAPVGKIRVPFPPESRLSGIERALGTGEEWLYERTFELEKREGESVLLHFGAVDQVCTVIVNGERISRHKGGYLPFDVDITAFVRNGKNSIALQVSDTLDHSFGWGKQRVDRGGMWYTPVSGIWQPVWLEQVPGNCIENIRLAPSLDSVSIEIEGGMGEYTMTVQTPDGADTVTFTGNSYTYTPKTAMLWSPENPYLYEFALTSGQDTVKSYFALRTVEVGKVGETPRICLNGKPYFFHGLLDQGYFPDGIYLPGSPDGYENDILIAKKMGFNMLRKHIKIEPQIFYYLCDKLGMIVFQDMVNSGDYSFLVDTALPTIGLKRGISHKASERRKRDFLADSERTVELLYNHPSVCYYTIFNEGWGQFEADKTYDALQPLDPSRIWDTTSGWFWGKKSDVQSEHIYFKKINIKPWGDRPVVLSEFGGYACRVEGHIFNPDNNYGYSTYPTPEAWQKAAEALYREQILPAIEKSGLCAAVLTQISDVEDETNGLVTYDRQFEKADAAVMAALAKEIYACYNQAAGK
ncbi:MAG: MFS transporter [Clostridia bacterium]|nr:MFS transporter [Clostridia bacterium]